MVCLPSLDPARPRTGRAGRLRLRQGLLALGLALAAVPPVAAQASAPGAAASAPVPAVPVARDEGRLRAGQLGLVVNEDDPYSVAVGAYYQARRGLGDAQVLRVRLPRAPRLTVAEAEALRRQVDAHFGPHIQALALAWREPYAVECLSITGVLALGWQEGVCRRSCDRTPSSPYFNHPSAAPFTRFGWRPSMLLAAANEAQARQLIDRGVASDGRLGRRFSPEAVALLVRSGDAARNVRARWYPEPVALPALRLTLRQLDGLPQAPQRVDDVVLVQTGAARLGPLDGLGFLPGALADHLTSFGGVLEGKGQSTVLEWIAAGATASHGTVSEPCNHVQKFPLSAVLLGHYLQGSTAIEAYWKSVAWPLQSLFVGEPLAAPFAHEPAPAAAPTASSP